MTRTCLAIMLLFATVTAASAQGPVFLVRHAERADGGASMGSDPDLSTAGRARAEKLAAMLKDTGIRAIYTTEFKRTQQTAAPLAKALGLTPVVVSAKDMKALIAKVTASSEPALIVGHSNTVDVAIAALGVTDPVKIGDDEFDNFFIVTRGGTTALIRLRY